MVSHHRLNFFQFSFHSELFLVKIGSFLQNFGHFWQKESFDLGSGSKIFRWTFKNFEFSLYLCYFFNYSLDLAPPWESPRSLDWSTVLRKCLTSLRKLPLLEQSLIKAISHLITVFELTDYWIIYFFKFQSLRFEKWIEQVRSNFRHAATVDGPLYVPICNPCAIELGPSTLDQPSGRLFSAAGSGTCVLHPICSASPPSERFVTDKGPSVTVCDRPLNPGLRSNASSGSKSHVNINENYMKQIERSPAGIKASDVLSGRYVSPTGPVHRPGAVFS